MTFPLFAINNNKPSDGFRNLASDIPEISSDIIFKEKVISQEEFKTSDKIDSFPQDATWRVLDPEEFSTYFSNFAEFNDLELNQIKELILKSEKYSKIDFEITETGQIIFYLSPIIRVYRITFKGNTNIYNESLNRELELYSPKEFSTETLKKDLESLKKYYDKRGYPNAIIDYETKFDESTNFIDIKYIINEGTPVYITEIDISYEGFETVHKLDRLLDIQAGEIFDKIKLKENLNKLNEFLTQNKYITAKIFDPQIKLLAKNTLAKISIKINPGRRFEVKYNEHSYGSEHTLGIDSFQKISRLNSALGLIQMTSFKKEDLAILSQRIRGYYRENGYIYARVEGGFEDSIDSPQVLKNIYERLKNFKFTVKSIFEEVKDTTEYVVSIPGKIKNIVTGKKEENLKVLRTLIFNIHRGEQIRVGSIFVHGNRAYSAGRIKSIIKSASNFSEGSPFSKEKLEIGLESLTGFYQLHGYLNFRVSDIDYNFKKEIMENTTQDGFSPKQNQTMAEINIYISENPRSFIKNINFSENITFSLKKLNSIIGIKKGEIYNIEKIEAAAAKLKNFYNSEGFYYFKFKTSNFSYPNSDFTEIDINFDFEEGNKIFIGSIILKGNHKTKSKVLVRKIDLQENVLLTSEKMISSEEYLMRLGLFSSTSIRTTGKVYKSNEKFYHNIIIDVKEAPSKNIKLGIGYDSEEKARTFIELKHSNLGGYGRQARFKFKTNRRLKIHEFKLEEENVGFWEYSFNVGYREPSLAKRPFDIEIDTDASYSQQKLASYNLYRWSKITSLIKNALFNKHINLTLSWKLTSDKIFESQIESDNGILTISSIYPELFLDFRDSPVNTRKGILTQLKFEKGDSRIFSTFEYWEVYSKTTLFIPLFLNLNFFPSISAGYIKPLNTNLIPTQKRYFLGGRSTIRGYDLDHAGLKENDSPVGGNAFWNIRNNLKIPVYGSMNLITFYDIGRLYYGRNQTSGIMSSTGLGILYESPIGAVNFEIGFKLNKKESEPLVRFHFSIGNF